MWRELLRAYAIAFQVVLGIAVMGVMGWGAGLLIERYLLGERLAPFLQMGGATLGLLAGVIQAINELRRFSKRGSGGRQ